MKTGETMSSEEKFNFFGKSKLYQIKRGEYNKYYHIHIPRPLSDILGLTNEDAVTLYFNVSEKSILVKFTKE